MINFKFDVQRFAFSGGTGTETDPFKISTARDLVDLAIYVNDGNDYSGKYFKVTADIDLSSIRNWTPIGNGGKHFRGNFDGDNKIISNFTAKHYDTENHYELTGLYEGLFGRTAGATIKNVHLTNVNIKSKYYEVGPLVNFMDETQIINCSVQGDIEAYTLSVTVGGICGTVFSGSMKNCAFIGSIKTPNGSHEFGPVAGFSTSWLGDNYYCGDFGNVDSRGATRIFNVNMPNGVTSDSIVTFVGKNYIKSGEVTFNYLGETYKYNVSGDVNVTLKNNKLFANETDLGFTFPYNLDGNGSENNPFIIKTEENLRQLAAYVNSGKNCYGLNFKLANDIKLTSDWTPIGNSFHAFNGTFDGNDKIIDNLTTNGGDYQGLFGKTNIATIKNVNLTNVNVTGMDYVGSLVGDTSTNTKIINCTANGNVKSTKFCFVSIGGLVGWSGMNSMIDGCTFGGNVEGVPLHGDLGAHCGGIAGRNSGTIQNCAYLGGKLSGGMNIGVITGKNYVERINIINNYYCGDLNVSDNGATKIFNVNVPGNVTSSAFVEVNGQKYVKGGEITLNYKGYDYKYTVTGDITVTIKDKRLYINDTAFQSNFPDNLYGDGSENNPYLIKTEENLQQLAVHVNKGNNCAGLNFKLADNITMTSNFTPIGNVRNKFGGKFDGDGKTISNLTIEDENNLGLFGYTDGATIQNVNLTNFNVTGKNNAGSLVGYTLNTTISNCTAQGDVKADGNGSNFGGLVGINNGTIKNCTYLGGTITGNDIGAICGKNYGTITESYCYGNSNVPDGGATRIFNFSVPNGVTSDAFIEINGQKYIKGGEITLNYKGNSYKYTVTGDITVTIRENKLFANETALGTTFPENLDGNGSENNPYLIKTEENLRQLAVYVNNGNSCADLNFKLANDIALTGEFTPIGNIPNKFCGKFDGDGKIISDLTISAKGYFDYAFFGAVEGATIKNINLKNVNVTGTWRIGSLIGTAQGDSQIINCSANGNIKSAGFCSFMGGLIGQISTNSNVTVDGCTFSGNIEGKIVPDEDLVFGSHVGGIVGVCSSTGTIKNCAYLGGTLKSSDGGAIMSKLDKTENFIDNYYYGTLDEGISDNGATKISKLTSTSDEKSNSIVEINGTKYIKENDAAQGLKLYASDNGDTLTGGNGNDSLWGGAGKDTFVHNGGNDIIYGFGNGDSLKINGLDEITATYDTANNDIKIPCGSTGSVTLKNFTTNEFPINSSTWTLNGSTLTKK